MQQAAATRGHGILENLLSRLRTRKAHQFITAKHKSGSILDVGCGAHPFHLINSGFKEKHGIDQIRWSNEKELVREFDVKLYTYDVEEENHLPFADDSFDVVTMLAVYEHIRAEVLDVLLTEIYRVLKSESGRLVITTPSKYAEPVLEVFARFGIVSKVEIDEHQPLQRPKQVRDTLIRAGFAPENVRVGTFEALMNIYAVADK